MFKVAVTGGIGSGKSAACDHFARLGVTLVDTDLIARQVVEPGRPAFAAISDHFGPFILDSRGRLDRGRLREQVFRSPDERRWLEALLHPLIRLSAQAEAQAATGDYVVLVIPLLAEGGWDGGADRILVIDCPEAVQIARCRARDGMTEGQARAILAAQANRAKRLALADDVIDNSGELPALQRQVERLHHDYLGMAREKEGALGGA